ncbi:unnamed protein product [Closterium sp. NIES-53]
MVTSALTFYGAMVRHYSTLSLATLLMQRRRPLFWKWQRLVEEASVSACESACTGGAAGRGGGQVVVSCSCRLLTHPSLIWHHHLGHPSLQRLRRMHSRLLVSSLLWSLPPPRPSLTLPCTPCVERAAPHSSSFSPTTAPLQTVHMDVWGPGPVAGQGRKRYFLLVDDDYTRYTTVFSLQIKGEIRVVLIPCICVVHCQLSARFC